MQTESLSHAEGSTESREGFVAGHPVLAVCEEPLTAMGMWCLQAYEGIALPGLLCAYLLARLLQCNGFRAHQLQGSGGGTVP